VSGPNVAVSGGDALIGSEAHDQVTVTVSGSGMPPYSGIFLACESDLPFQTLANCSYNKEVPPHADAKGNYSFPLAVSETFPLGTRTLHCDANTEPCGITVMIADSGTGDTVPILWV
jgi:hypothetical protein